MRCPQVNDLPPPELKKYGWPWTEESPQLPDTMPDGRPWPQITVVTPSYNQGPFLEETLRSVLLQGYPNLEYIVIDGGSKDESVSIIKKYEPWLAYWVSEKDRGQTHAINKGWQRATGDVIAWLNSDDVYPVASLHQAGEAFGSNPDIVMCYGDSIATDENSHYLRTKRLTDFTEQTLLCHRNMSQPSVFLRRQVLEEIGYPQEELHYVMDREFFLRVWHHYGASKCLYVPEVLSYTRIWAETKQATGVAKISAEWRKVLQQFFQQHGQDFTHLPQVKRKAFSGSFLRQARSQEQAGQRFQAQISTIRAALLLPGVKHRIRLLARMTLRIWKPKSKTVPPLVTA